MRKKLAIQDGATHVSVYPVGTTIAGGGEMLEQNQYGQ